MAKNKSTESSSELQTVTGNYNYEARLAALTPEKKQELAHLTEHLNTGDIGSVQSFGSELSRIVAQNGNVLLNSVRADNSSEVVQLTNELLNELNLIDIDELNTNTKWRKFLRNIPIIGNIAKSVDKIMVKYDTISDNVDKISKKIDSAKVVALRDNGTLNQIFENNKNYIEQMRDLILAAKLKEEEIQHQVEDMIAKPEEFDAIDVQDVQNYQASLRKKTVELETVCFVMEQNLVQIRATQKNNFDIANKSDNIVNNVIPLWKNQLAISIIMNNQKNSIDAQRRITETTNKILVENAKNLKINSVNVAKANEENIISLNTLRETTNKLIETAQEVKAIHDKAEAERLEIEKSIAQFSSQIEQQITQNAY